MIIKWKIKPFAKLTTTELHELLKIRAEIFVVEQNCSYLDIDGKDIKAKHLIGYYKNNIIAYARIFLKKEFNNEYNSIGRLCVKKSCRNKKIGDQLIKKAINIFPKNEIITISAQKYLKNFYKKHLFNPIGKEYLEDNIPHIQMILKKLI